MNGFMQMVVGGMVMLAGAFAMVATGLYARRTTTLYACTGVALLGLVVMGNGYARSLNESVDRLAMAYARDRKSGHLQPAEPTEGPACTKKARTIGRAIDRACAAGDIESCRRPMTVRRCGDGIR